MEINCTHLVFYSLEPSCITELCSFPGLYDQHGLKDFLLIPHVQKQEVSSVHGVVTSTCSKIANQQTVTL